MKIFGIDPGTATTGFGVLEVQQGRFSKAIYGTIETPRTLSPQARLTLQREKLLSLLESHKPDIAAAEKIFFTKNVKTAMSVAQARGVILETLQSAGIHIEEFTPNEVKMSVAGYGNADKRQVQYMVAQILGLEAPPEPDDAADALAIAICCSQRLKKQE